MDFSWIEAFPPLKKLTLHCAGFTDSKIEALKKHKESLEVLDLEGSSVGELPGLKEFTNLKRLRFGGSRLTTANIPESLEVFGYVNSEFEVDLTHLKNLPKLRVVCIDIHNDELVETFKKHAPQAKIVDKHSFGHSHI